MSAVVSVCGSQPVCGRRSTMSSASTEITCLTSGCLSHAISLEVAEHLPEASAQGFVASLTRLAPVVLFSAAVPLQGGAEHVNEQWQEYWRSKFSELDYVACDAIRPVIWGNEDVFTYYQQNILVYVAAAELGRYPKLASARAGRSVDLDRI